MPKIDFNGVDDVNDFTPLPEGKYLCRVAEVEEATTRNGDEMWKLKFAIESGPHKGRIVFDNMVFSDAAKKRVKLICSRLGIETSSEVDLNPDDIKGRCCYLTLEIGEYEDHEGNIKKKNVVPFTGYERAEGHTPPQSDKSGGAEDDGEENLPF